MQKDVYPPRTFVPRVLAALAVGAVTIGEIPYACADPIATSAVTEDTVALAGVAGSIDGSAATITVGTAGGGATPHIWDGSMDSNVFGSYYHIGDGADRAFTLTGGRAIVHSGTMAGVYGGFARSIVSGTENGTMEVVGSSVVVTGGTITGDLYGGNAVAVGPSTGKMHAAVRGNVVRLSGGSYVNRIYGGNAVADSSTGTRTAIAENNTVYITGGSYDPAAIIYVGYADTAGSDTAIARNNTLEIADAQDLSLPILQGGVANGASAISEGNALILRNAKNITASEVHDFQKVTFYAPAGMTESDAMLKVTDTWGTYLEGMAIEAYLPGNSSASKLTLMETPGAAIITDAETTMTVYEGISGTLPNGMRLADSDQKLVVDRSGAFQLNEDHAKSLAETVAGAAAFLGTGANLFTGAGMMSASTEAAAASGFSPFAALSGSSLRHETGSHVEMKGMNLAVGFSREVKRGGSRLLFGPLVEYGRGTYDSYVNAVHGDGSVRYLGAGGFLRREQAGGMFYEGSLRFGRSKMDYGADLSIGSLKTHASYDTDANYLGAHLGVGQEVTADNGSKREIYLRYFYTRQNGSSATLSTGERYDFSAVDSHRLRTGARWTMPQKGGAFSVGASVQYEFGGDASAAYHRPGGLSYTSPSPSLQGFSGSLELGWKAAMSANTTADLSVEGWLGKQRGVTFHAGFAWMF